MHVIADCHSGSQEVHLFLEPEFSSPCSQELDVSMHFF